MGGNRVPANFGELIQEHLTDALENLRVAMPGRVESYDDDANTVEVTPLLRAPVRTDDGRVRWQDLPKLTGIPVVMPQAGGRRIKLPMSPGDHVLLVFCDFGIDGWKIGPAAGSDEAAVQAAANRNGDGPVTPATAGTHQLGDAIAIPGLFNALGSSPSDAIEIAANGDVTVNSGNIKIGDMASQIALGGGTNPVAYLGAQVQAGPFAGVITACPLNLTTKV
jgi:hypothetical protein